MTKTTEAVKRAIRKSMSVNVQAWFKSKETPSLAYLFYLLMDTVESLIPVSSAVYNDLVYDELESIVLSLPEVPDAVRKKHLQTNLQQIRRYIAAQLYYHDLARDQIKTIGFESMKEVLFYISALYAMRNLPQLQKFVADQKQLSEKIEQAAAVFTYDTHTRLNRTHRARMVDHIATDTTYPTEMKNMLTEMKPASRKPAAKKAKATKPAAPATPAATAPVAAPTDDTASLTPFQKRQLEKELAKKATDKPGQAASNAVLARSNPLLGLADEIVAGKVSGLPIPRTNWIQPTASEPRTWCEKFDLMEEGPDGTVITKKTNSVQCGYKPSLEEIPVETPTPTPDAIKPQLLTAFMLHKQTELEISRLMESLVAGDEVYADNWEAFQQEATALNENAIVYLIGHEKVMENKIRPPVKNDAKDKLILEAFEGVAAAVTEANNKFDKLKELLGK